jgi:hypothetical protein
MKQHLAAALVCVLSLSAQAQNNNCLTVHSYQALPGGYPPGLGTYEYERVIGNYIDSKVPPVPPAIPETNPAPIMGAMFLAGAVACELRRRRGCLA